RWWSAAWSPRRASGTGSSGSTQGAAGCCSASRTASTSRSRATAAACSSTAGRACGRSSRRGGCSLLGDEQRAVPQRPVDRDALDYGDQSVFLTQDQPGRARLVDRVRLLHLDDERRDLSL